MYKLSQDPWDRGFLICWVRTVSSKCSPYTNSVNIIWEFDRIANYYSHPGRADEKLWGWGSQTSALTSHPGDSDTC